ncbi:MAG: hydantoinase/oxoprolinase family protein [Thermodesulfobacteriota bacterium]|jgi:N-methylhydantoinase A/acetophenone carboxylase
MANIIVGIDTGGTFTDGFLSDGTRIERIKVDTTPHDLTVCFMNCLEEGARAFGFKDLRSFLKEVQVLRFSSTTSTNILAQRIGDKVGVLVTKGFEDGLYKKEGGTRLPEFLLIPDLIETIQEEVTPAGEVTKTPNDADIMEKLKRLLDYGARIIVISLHNAHLNHQNEMRVKEIIGTYYPKHYLGSLPVIPASKFCNHPDEAGRTNLAVLDAYVHRKVSGTLYHAEDLLRESGYRRPLLAVNSSGGCSGVAKTKAADIIGSSPTAGYMGAVYWAKKYALPNVITIDIGGTSIDIGLIVGGETLYSEERNLFDTPVATPVWEVSSIGLGGGSIAKVNLKTKSVEVGPESAGALPGPACYDLGGENPTVTDADVVLKRIDPEYFLGGKRKLNADRAREAILTMVANPLGLDVEGAAMAILNKADELMAAEIKNMLDKIGKSPIDFVLFAFGGAGATHCCDIGERLGVPRIYTFPFSSTFGAFGTSMMDLMHIYMCYKSLPLAMGGNAVLDIEAFNDVAKKEQENALRDMVGEGFKGEDIKWKLELEIKGELDRRSILITSPKVLLNNPADTQAILENYEQERSKLRHGKASRNIQIEVFYLTSYCPLFKYEFQRQIIGDADPSHALKTERAVLGTSWSPATKVYTKELLKCGNVVFGPAILESSDTTYVIPKGWQFSVDEYLNGVIGRLK